MTGRLVSIHAHGRLYAPAPDRPSVTWFRHLCELGDTELDALEYAHAEHWYSAAYDHAPARVVHRQAYEVAMRFRTEAERTEDPRLRAYKLAAACTVLKGSMP